MMPKKCNKMCLFFMFLCQLCVKMVPNDHTWSIPDHTSGIGETIRVWVTSIQEVSSWVWMFFTFLTHFSSCQKVKNMFVCFFNVTFCFLIRCEGVRGKPDQFNCRINMNVATTAAALSVLSWTQMREKKKSSFT